MPEADLEAQHQDEPEKSYREELWRCRRPDPTHEEPRDDQDHERADEDAELASEVIPEVRGEEQGSPHTMEYFGDCDQDPDRASAD
jgi:hypothetical protein